MHTLSKAAATSADGFLMHGPGGIMSAEGLENAVVSNHIKPRGLSALLPAFANNSEDPRYGIFTGIGDDQGAEATEPCGDAPTAFMLGGAITAQYGDIFRDTNTIEVRKALMKLRRSDFTDLNLVGSILNTGDAGIQYPGNVSEGDFLNNLTVAEMITAAQSMNRKLTKLTFQGNPSNNTLQGYKEFPGIDLLVNTGWVDANTNTSLGIDPVLIDANHASVQSNSTLLVDMIEDMEHYLYETAEELFGGWEALIVMRPGLWRDLVNVWPVRNAGDRAAAAAASGVTVYIDGFQEMEQRNQMRRSMSIEINGRMYPVVIDHGIYEHNNTNTAITAGTFSSDLYFLPLRVGGTFPVLYYEYVNWALGDLAAAGPAAQDFWTDGGRFLWGYDGSKYCFKLGMRVSPRLVLRTPQLAGRIQNLNYSSTFHNREPFPSDAYGEVLGLSLRTAPTTYTHW